MEITAASGLLRGLNNLYDALTKTCLTDYVNPRNSISTKVLLTIVETSLDRRRKNVRK